MAVETCFPSTFGRNMQLAAVLSLLVPFSGGAVTRRTTPVPTTVECDIVPLSECTVSCGGGWQLMKYACVDPAPVCQCPTNPIYYQCNNRPCLSKNATLLDVFYDAEDQQEEENELEYYEDDETAPAGAKMTKKHN